MPKRDTRDVLQKVRETLATTKQGLGDLVGNDATRRVTGLRNVAVFGRAVTSVLQTLRNIDRDAFNEWYDPRVEEMRRDPLLRYFYKLRTEILKEGGPQVGHHTHVEYLDTADLAPLMQNPPPGAQSFFMIDEIGGSGWHVELPDGSVEKYYVQLPEAVRMQVRLHFPDPPTDHLGEPIADTSVENLSRLYVAYLDQLVSDADHHFGEAGR
jgi:hypothetical protein